VCLCVLYGSQWTGIISVYSVNWLIFKTETESVYSAVRIWSLNTIQVNFRLNLNQYTALTPICSVFAPVSQVIRDTFCISWHFSLSLSLSLSRFLVVRMSSDPLTSKLEEHPSWYPTAYCLLTIGVCADLDIATLCHPTPGWEGTHTCIISLCAYTWVLFVFDDALLSPLCNAHTKIARAVIAGLIASVTSHTLSILQEKF
jgi:hypothetical protein